MAHDTDPANLSIDTEHDCHTIRHNATRYQQATLATLSGDTLTDPVHYIQRHAHGSRLTGMARHSTAHRHGHTHGGKESIFYREAGRHDRGDP